MMDQNSDLALAELQSESARRRLTGTLVEIQARLNPKALAREAAQELKEAAQEIARDGLDELKRHPLTLVGAIVAIGLFFVRGPLRRLMETDADETPEPPASLTPERARARRKGPSE